MRTIARNALCGSIAMSTEDRAYVRRRLPEPDAAYALADTFLAAWRRLDSVPEEPLPWRYRIAGLRLCVGEDHDPVVQRDCVSEGQANGCGVAVEQCVRPSATDEEGVHPEPKLID